LVIAKGQGNYETLNEIDRPVFFMLKAKCPVVARHIGCAIGSYVIKKHANRSMPLTTSGVLSATKS